MQTSTSLGFVSIKSFDISRSEAFYKNILGFKMSSSKTLQDVIFETEAGSTFVVRRAIVDVPHTAKEEIDISIWLKVHDPNSLYKKLPKERVSLINPIQVGYLGSFFTLEDPDGHYITIYG